MRRTVRGGIRLRGLKVSGTFPSGNARHYYRANGMPLPDAPKDSAEFLAAYVAASKHGEGPLPKGPKAHHKTGTIGAGIRAYMAADTFFTLATGTRQTRRRILEKIEAAYGVGKLADLRAKHIRQDIAKLTPHPANARLKVWRALGRWWVDSGLIETDPARDVRTKATPDSDGHTPWTQADVDLFRSHWPVGNPQRLALELMASTGAAIGDAIRLGPNNIKDGWMTYRRQKSGTLSTVPVESAPVWFPTNPHLADCLSAAPMALTFLCTSSGKPRSAKAAAQWFSGSARAAGLDRGKTAHGVRKWLAVTMAERGATAEQRMAVLGHDTTSQTQAYSQSADAKRIISGTLFDNSPDQVVKLVKKPC